MGSGSVLVVVQCLWQLCWRRVQAFKSSSARLFFLFEGRVRSFARTKMNTNTQTGENYAVASANWGSKKTRHPATYLATSLQTARPSSRRSQAGGRAGSQWTEEARSRWRGRLPGRSQSLRGHGGGAGSSAGARRCPAPRPAASRLAPLLASKAKAPPASAGLICCTPCYAFLSNATTKPRAPGMTAAPPAPALAVSSKGRVGRTAGAAAEPTGSAAA